MIAQLIRGMPFPEYRALKALNASGAHTIERECPKKYWHTSPFNPNAEPEEPKDHFDIGSATHLLVLEPHAFEAATVLIEADDYRTADARKARDQARNAGKIPLLSKNLATVRAMTAAIDADPVARAFRDDGEAEVVMTWIDPEFNIPCKLRVDQLPHDLLDLRDIKSALTANPGDFERAAWDHGYAQRAAWYLDAPWEEVTGKRPRYYWFIAVEKKAPWCVSVMRYTEEDIEWGRVLNTFAKALFADCMETGQWPGYRPRGATRDRAFDIRLPSWARSQLQDLVETGQVPAPRSRAELKRQLLKHRLAAKLLAPTKDRDYMPPPSDEPKGELL